ncbi:MAG: tetratricopeptide repeat protein [Gammaproteobacteria bacterium]|nr:tetratricopeptide repeat protein [Gammaproteobacteria bacterium]
MSLVKNSICIGFTLLLVQGCASQAINPPASKPAASQSAPSEKQVEAAPVKKVGKKPSSAKILAPAPQPRPEVKPLNSELLYHLLAGEIAGQRGQMEQAVSHYMVVLNQAPDAEVAERATRIAVFARNDKNALEAARIWVKLVPDNIEAQQVTAALLVRTGQTDVALTHFENILKQTENTVHDGFMLIVSLLSKERDKKTALSVMEKLVAGRQQNPAALYAYSHLALLVGSLDKAETNIKKALALRSEWTEAHLLHGNILIRQGRDADALKMLRETVDEYSDDIKLRLFYARKLVDEKQYEQAYEQFSEVLDQDSEHVDAIYALGLLSIQINKLEQAEARFQSLITKNKRVSEAHYYLGEIRERQQQDAEAIQFYKNVSKEPHYLEAQIRVAALLAKANRLDEARAHLHRVKANTLEVELRLYLAEGELLNAARQYQQAFEVYTDALEQMPGNSRLLYARALVAEKFDRLDIAIQDMQLILKNEPENIQALNALGYTLVDRTERIEEGFAYVQKAFAKKPDDAAILDSMGWAYYRLGKYEQALEYLRRALNKLQDSEIASHLGEVLWVSGDHAGARKVWDNALQQTPKHELLLDVIQRLTK